MASLAADFSGQQPRSGRWGRAGPAGLVQVRSPGRPPRPPPGLARRRRIPLPARAPATPPFRLQHLEGGLAPAGPCSHAGVAGRWRALQSTALMTSRKDPPSQRARGRRGSSEMLDPGRHRRQLPAGEFAVRNAGLGQHFSLPRLRSGCGSSSPGPPTEHEASPLPARSSEAHKGSLREVPGPSPSQELVLE